VLIVSKPPQNKEEFTGFIPMDKLKITHCKSSKPGGQHVNSVNSRVTISFKLSEAEWIPEKVKKKLAVLVSHHLIQIVINHLGLTCFVC